MPSTSLEIKAVTRTFGDFAALSDVSLALNPGELISILGPSGCGKSTLLRIIAGLDDADSGDVLIDGQSVRHVTAKDRGVAFVFQNYALYPNLSGFDNIAAPLVMRDLSALDRLPLIGKWLPSARAKFQSIHSRVASVAELLKIEPYLARKPAQMSGGQRQRVALGRALIREPQLFLLDEPFANLDASLRTHTRSELVALQRRLGTTTVFVTHDQAEAMAMSDRIAVMFNGRIRQIATPDELYRNPVDIEVAQFLSQPLLNSLPARCFLKGRVMVAGEVMAMHDACDAGSEGTLGFRPEHCALAHRRTPGTLPVRVERIEHAGSEASVFVRLASTGATCVARVPSVQLGGWAPGTHGWMGIDAASAWFFPRASHGDIEARKVA